MSRHFFAFIIVRGYNGADAELLIKIILSLLNDYTCNTCIPRGHGPQGRRHPHSDVY